MRARSVRLLLSLSLLPSLSSCHAPSTSDDASDDLSAVADAEASAEADAEPESVDTTDAACPPDLPRCDGESVLACVDGVEELLPCPAGTVCNFGVCEESRVDLPRDAGPHTDRTEWWYYTGHVGDGEHEYGFEVTIFRYDLAIFTGYMCHVAVLDAVAGIHVHTDEILPLPAHWTRSPVVLDVGSCRFELDGAGFDHVTGRIERGAERDSLGAPWSIALWVEPQKRPALHGDHGVIPMGDRGGTSWYYSYTRLDAAGTIGVPDGSVYDVGGVAWMDHQWGDFDPMTEFKGWDWWSVQLDDGRELMLFQFRDWDDVLVGQAGTLVLADGNQVTFSGFDAFSIAPRREWPSPHTDGVYPLDWDITIAEGAFQLAVETHVDDQEMYNPAQNYWEGATTVTGTADGVPVTGVGYTELTGYASDLLDPP
ncbi:MAG: hypothetical protein HY905_01600 [Deltaproteobacteria bacterium]|nr:hypothetical protein [Deltaproteobacteria bacterium]